MAGGYKAIRGWGLGLYSFRSGIENFLGQLQVEHLWDRGSTRVWASGSILFMHLWKPCSRTSTSNLLGLWIQRVWVLGLHCLCALQTSLENYGKNIAVVLPVWAWGSILFVWAQKLIEKIAGRIFGGRGAIWMRAWGSVLRSKFSLKPADTICLGRRSPKVWAWGCKLFFSRSNSLGAEGPPVFGFGAPFLSSGFLAPYWKTRRSTRPHLCLPTGFHSLCVANPVWKENTSE